VDPKPVGTGGFIRLLNPKHQITNKSQYPMTKTFTEVVPNRFAKFALSSIFHLAHSVHHLFEILNLGHWNLFEIWVLVLGILVITIKQSTF